eukprot:5028392-Amphidinium_carterae.1
MSVVESVCVVGFWDLCGGHLQNSDAQSVRSAVHPYGTEPISSGSPSLSLITGTGPCPSKTPSSL